MSVTETTYQMLERAKEMLCKELWAKALTEDQLLTARYIAGSIIRKEEFEESYRNYLARHQAAMMGKTSPINKRKFTDIHKALSKPANRQHLLSFSALDSEPPIEERIVHVGFTIEPLPIQIDPSREGAFVRTSHPTSTVAGSEVNLVHSELTVTLKEPMHEQLDAVANGTSSSTIWSAED